MAGNDLLDNVRADLNAALDRETQIRVNYETTVIPQLERDLQAARQAVDALIIERDALQKYKLQAEAALIVIERAYGEIGTALAVSPGDAPVGGTLVDEALPPSWR